MSGFRGAMAEVEHVSGFASRHDAQKWIEEKSERKTRPPQFATSNESYQIYFAASAIRTIATMTNMAIWTAMLFIKPRPFWVCVVM